MYVMKRTSGGRGEYEAADKFGSITVNDLLERSIWWDLSPFPPRNIDVTVRMQGGKPRLRRLGNVPQLARQVAALLLLPKPVRDEATLKGGTPVVREGAYVLRRLDVTGLALAPGVATMKFGNLEYESDATTFSSEDAEARLRRIAAIHARASEYSPAVELLLGQHATLLGTPGTPIAPAEALVESLMAEVALATSATGVPYASGTDVLVALEGLTSAATTPPPPPIEDIPPAEVEIRLREGSKWRRWASMRGARGARFREKVQLAYGYRCVVCGLVLPKNKYCEVPGVDAAHILPWAKYDLDVTSNGLCLCKLHHWAFDRQVIAIVPNGSDYEVRVTTKGRTALAADPNTLAELSRHEGPVPDSRLPSSVADRPRKEFLEKLYEDIPPGT